ncbi:MAG: hypothetical protein JOZ72_09420 [Alphaproteobacteria bacterium]|nr:hypothetical protein [Alphaproteobacteria bacterium]
MVAETYTGMAQAAPSWRVFSPSVRRVLIGLFLIGAFAATSAVLLLIVTAEQLQNAVGNPDFAPLKISTGWVRQDVAYLEQYWADKGAVTRREKAANDELFQISARNAKTRAVMSSTADGVRNFIDLNDSVYILPPLKLRTFNGDVPPPPPPPKPAEASPAPATLDTATPDEAATPPPGKPVTATEGPGFALANTLPVAWPFGSAVDDYFDAYYNELDTLPNAEKARQSLNTFKVEVYKRMTPFFAAKAAYDSDASTKRALEAQINALQKQAKQLDDDSQAPGTPLANGSYWSLTEDFLSFKTLVGDFAYNIVALPRMMLVLMIAIFMGILGSLIYITMDFYNNPEARGFWDIMFRIGLGAGVAFALFFFAAAGTLALAQTKSGGQSDMSPYLIAFLGITGGYLSDRVTQWMREVGENTFKIKGDGPPNRWAIDLGGKLAAAGLDNATLANATGATVGDAESWVAQTKPVPGDKQGLVAAFLRIHPSQIFTDIPPG